LAYIWVSHKMKGRHTLWDFYGRSCFSATAAAEIEALAGEKTSVREDAQIAALAGAKLAE